MWTFIKALLGGMSGVVRLQESPLYRYPYRNGAEAMRGDWNRIGRDIENALAKEEKDE